MRKRILFVDDERILLESLKRKFRSESEIWDMQFVNSAEEALLCMQSCPVDVVVSDVEMPGMTGIQLLEKVKELYPDTMRIIVSGYPDQNLMLRKIGTFHQYQIKPCATASLKAAIRRVLNQRTSLRSASFERVVSNVESLPTFPELYSKITTALDHPNTDLDEVGQMIQQDIGMTANILKLVNSAYMGLARTITHPSEAITFLGVETVKSLVLALGAFAKFDPARLGNLSMEKLWNHSLKVAQTAAAMAKVEHAGLAANGEAFVAGILHDAGKLVMALNFPEQYNQVLKRQQIQKLSSIQAEQDIFGTDHTAVGGFLFSLWGLPAAVVDAIVSHHEPGSAGCESFSCVTAVHVANALLSNQSAEAMDILPIPAALDEHYLAKLGLLDRVQVWQQAFVDNP